MKLNQNQQQRQNLSPQMIQSAKLLQMGAMELREYIQEQLEENPMLESEERGSTSQSNTDELAQKLKWLCASDIQNRYYYQDDSFDPIEKHGDTDPWEESLYHHLRGQIDFHALSPAMGAAVECILQSLNAAGRLDDPVEDLADHAGVSRTLIQKAIRLVQGLDPAGVAAQSLSECLILQLQRRGETGLALAIVRDYLEDVGQDHYNYIAQQTGAGRGEVQAACALIRSLEPRPCAKFASGEEARYLIPDLAIVPVGYGFEVALNDGSIPSIRVSPYYHSLLASCDDAAVREYLFERTRQAEWVVKAIEQRKSTLLACAKAIAVWQEDFFRQGPGHLRPMTLIDMAEKLGVHESTVSRAIRDKYLQCIYGVFPLKYFFIRTLFTTSDDLSAVKVKAALRRLIQAEDGCKPLSDQKLCNALAKRGITISRRTVAKYREELGIPSASGRREQQRHSPR